jgi:hypothetical protein
MTDGRGARPVEDGEDVAALDDPNLREELSGLSLADQIALFRRSDWQERVKIVSNSDLAGEIVASIPDEEVLLTFKGAGEDAGLSLIPHCSEEQLRFILDIDLWNEHAVDEEQVLKWLDYFVTSGERTVLDFVRACDVELVVVFLGKLIRLIPFDDAVEMGEELTSIMPDDIFIVQSLYPEETATIRLFLTTIMADDRDLYSELRYSTYRAIATEVEDEAYRWRNSRLEEKGILEYGEAASIYDALPEPEVRGLIGEEVRPYYSGANDIQVPAFYPLGLSGSRPLYYELLEGLDDEAMRNRIAGDASYVTNRLLIADGQTIGDVDATQTALSRLFSLANVGLLHLAETNGMEPARVLEAVSISNLFRVGLGLVMALKAEADEVGRNCPPMPGFREYALFEDFHIGGLKGLRMKVPQHYEPEADGTGDYRDFVAPEEIATARALLAQISVLVEACYGKLDMISRSSAGVQGAAGGPAMLAASRMEFGNLLMTGFVHFTLGGEFDVTPLKRKELGTFLKAAFVAGQEGERSLDPALTEKFIAWLEHETGLNGHRWAILEAYVMERLELVEEDLADAASAQDVDSLLVESVLLAN